MAHRARDLGRGATTAACGRSARHGKRGPVEGNAVREEPGMSRRGVRQQPKHKAARPDIYRRRTQHEIWAAAPRRRRVGVCQTRQEGQRGGHLRCQRGPSVRRRVVCAGQLGGGAPQDVQIRRLTQHLGRRDPGAACVGCSAARNTLLGSSPPISTSRVRAAAGDAGARCCCWHVPGGGPHGGVGRAHWLCCSGYGHHGAADGVLRAAGSVW